MNFLRTILCYLRTLLTPPPEGLPADVRRWLRLLGGITAVYQILEDAADQATTNSGKRIAALTTMTRNLKLQTGFLLPDSIARLILEWAICLHKGPRPPR